MTEAAQITDDLILKDTVDKLRKLIEEEKDAQVKKEKRDKYIQKLRLVFEVYSNGKTLEEYIGSTSISVNSLPLKNETTKAEETKELKVEYPSNGTWAEKIISIFKQKNRVLKVTDIIDSIKDYETEYSDKQLLGVISNTINTNLVKKGFLKIYRPLIKTKGFYYGNPDWWENDKLKEDHMFIPKEKKFW